MRRDEGNTAIRSWMTVGAVAAALTLFGGVALADNPPSVRDDPLVRMPGTQPGQVTLEAPDRCLNCHAGYNQAIEPGFQWQGSMMSQSARDPLFWAATVVAAQDSQFALGRPNGSDLCLRCHFPGGWMEGRSDPTSGAALTGADYDGVQCDLCHRMVDPFFASTHDGTREGDDWAGYWDETNLSDQPSGTAADATRSADALVAASLGFFNGTPFYAEDRPVPAGYDEAAGGQYVVDPDAAKRASFTDAAARHQIEYSRYHKSAYFCGTCHDVSNPALANLGFDGTPPGDGSAVLPSEQMSAYEYFHVERTFSEFMLSAYARGGGAPGTGPFAPQVFDTSLPGDLIGRCQDCHMRDVVGAAADMNNAIVRPVESIEHPSSGMPLHDLTGGNAWVSRVLASSVPGSPNHDPVNEQLLGQGPAVLTLDLGLGLGINPAALLAGASRAEQQLRSAASITDAGYDSATGLLTFRIRNHTGHKLISGFPEGRRMFVSVRAYDSDGVLIHEVNPYDAAAGTLRGLPHSNGSPPLGHGQAYEDALVYEVHQSSAITGETATFHVVLADGRAKDNRIPPAGFDVSEAGDRLVVPVWNGVEDPGYFTAEEYAGGYDEVSIGIPPGAASIEIGLYYQTTSREYVEFLRDEINGTATTLPPGAYVAQTDPFFAALAAWGDTVWALWDHNRLLPGATPILMTSETVGVPPPVLPVPTLLTAVAGNQQVALTWTDEHDGHAAVTGYRVGYDQGGKLQPLEDLGAVTEYVDTGLSNGQTYCYRVATLSGSAASEPSVPLCATPENPGQTPDDKPPVVTIGAIAAGMEGTPVGMSGGFVDDDSTVWSGVVDWGDGTEPEPLSIAGTGFAATHAYADDGAFGVSVCILDDGAAEGCDDATAAIGNVSPTVITGGDAVTGIGQPVTRSGTFTDPGADVWTATVDWGDGADPEPLPLDGGSFHLEHAWSAAGYATVTVAVADDEGAIGSASFGVLVGPPCGGKPATLVGTDGPDLLTGGLGIDVIVGLGGDDTISGYGGDDIVCGDDGDDRLSGGAGDDLLFGLGGDDVMFGRGGADVLWGGPGADRIMGNAGADRLYGEAGGDELAGGYGGDVLDGGTEADLMYGGSGRDLLRGAEGDDLMYGMVGDDLLVGGTGYDSADGGPDVDTCRAEAVVRCEAGATAPPPAVLAFAA